MTWFHLEPHVAAALGIVYVLLLVTTAAVLAARRLRPDRDLANLWDRTRTWWVIVLFFSAILGVPLGCAVAGFALISFLALKEYLSLIPTRQADRLVLLWLYLAIAFQYGFIYIEWYGMFIIFIPVYMFLLIPMQMVGLGQTEGFLRAAGTLHWGLMTTVFSLSHMAYLLVLPGSTPTVAGGAGLVLYLVLLTELNDMAQFGWGKLFGRRRMLRRVSPGKTWAGFFGGFFTTLAAAFLAAPYLTPLRPQHAVLVGCIIGLGGFFGDVTISALKRDVGTKDSGSLLPGHGGILDRVDSLTFTAPVFLHFVRFYYF